jgi:hypothetical protein
LAFGLHPELIPKDRGPDKWRAGPGGAGGSCESRPKGRSGAYSDRLISELRRSWVLRAEGLNLFDIIGREAQGHRTGEPFHLLR